MPPNIVLARSLESLTGMPVPISVMLEFIRKDAARDDADIPVGGIVRDGDGGRNRHAGRSAHVLVALTTVVPVGCRGWLSHNRKRKAHGQAREANIHSHRSLVCGRAGGSPLRPHPAQRNPAKGACPGPSNQIRVAGAFLSDAPVGAKNRHPTRDRNKEIERERPCGTAPPGRLSRTCGKRISPRSQTSLVSHEERIAPPPKTVIRRQRMS